MIQQCIQKEQLEPRNMRHNLARRSRNRSSAELHSAVARIWNPQDLDNSRASRSGLSLAEYNSALQQIKNLRYEVRGPSSRRARLLTNSSTKSKGCAKAAPRSMKVRPAEAGELGKSSWNHESREMTRKNGGLDGVETCAWQVKSLVLPQVVFRACFSCGSRISRLPNCRFEAREANLVDHQRPV